MKKSKTILCVLLFFVILISIALVSFGVRNAQKKELLKTPIHYGIYTIYPSCYKDGNETYVTFSVKNKNGETVIREGNKWLLRDFYEFDFGPDSETYPTVIVVSRDKETLFGKQGTVFHINEFSDNGK